MTDLPTTPGGWKVIYCDPPWRMKMRSEKGMGRCPDGPLPRARQRENNPERHYRTMTNEDIAALPVADVAAKDCLLLMWVIDPMLPEALEVAKAWGFTYKTVGFYWVKQRRTTSNRAKDMLHWLHKMFPMGTGYWTRANPEMCLLFTRGKPKRISAGVRKLVVSPRREHSRKPDSIIRDIEALCGDVPRLEMFARSGAPGWAVWGTETDRFADFPLFEEVGARPSATTAAPPGVRDQLA